MLNRQKTLLALISEAQHVPGRVHLFKYSFLLKEEGNLPNNFAFYDFVPYKFGPYSFSLERELHSLRACSYIEDLGQGFRIHPSMRKSVRTIVHSLGTEVRLAVSSILQRYGSMQRLELIRMVYIRYPHYAAYSLLRDLVPRNANKPKRAAPAIYTLGYEGNSIDKFLYGIANHGLATILDVRANPVSRKYGFAKNTMMRLAAKLGIRYVHIPELGIPSGERRGLSTPRDYQNLFSRYENEILPSHHNAVGQASRLVISEPTVLVCREEGHESCHRGRLANALQAVTGLSIVHLKN